MKKDSRAPLLIVVMVLLLPVIYLASYLSLSAPAIGGHTIIGGLNHKETYLHMCADYRWGGETTVRIYWPLEQLDRLVRPGAWEQKIVHPRRHPSSLGQRRSLEQTALSAVPAG